MISVFVLSQITPKRRVIRTTEDVSALELFIIVGIFCHLSASAGLFRPSCRRQD